MGRREAERYECLVDQHGEVAGLGSKRLGGELANGSGIGSDVGLIEEIVMECLEGNDLSGVDHLLKPDPHAAVLAAVLEARQGLARVQQLRGTKLDLAHAEQTSDKGENGHGIPAVRAAAEAAQDLLDRGPFAVALVAHHIGENLLLGLGRRLGAAEEVIRVEQSLRQRGLVVGPFEHAEAGEAEGDDLLACLGDTVARVAFADGIKALAIEVEWGLAQEFAGHHLHVASPKTVLLTALVENGLARGIPVAGVLLNVLLRLQKETCLIVQAGVGRQITRSSALPRGSERCPPPQMSLYD